jgi:hypothetical protein
LEIIFRWLVNTIAWDTKTTANSSGRLEDLFKTLPPMLHTPFVITYGVLQPVLPAALLDDSIWIIRSIVSFISLGWYILLPLLIFGVISAFKEKDPAKRSALLWIGLLIWVWIVLCSARAGGDQWDNPRYRTILLSLQVIYSAWAFQKIKSEGAFWLWRVLFAEALSILVFAEWYLSRQYPVIPRLPLPVMILLLFMAIVGIVIQGVIMDARKQKRIAVIESSQSNRSRE